MYASYSAEIVCELSAGNIFLCYIVIRDLIKRDGTSPSLEKPHGHAEQNVMKHLHSVCEMFS